MALGLAQGIIAGIDDIDRRELRRIELGRQQEADAIRREEMGLRRKEIARQDAEYERQQRARQELQGVADRSYRETEVASPYAGDERQSLSDPEFGLEAAGAPQAGLQSVRKTRQFDQGAYDEGVYQWMLKNDPSKAMEFRKASAALRSEEAKGFVKSVMIGDIASAERFGRDSVMPGTLKVNREAGTVSGMRPDGSPFEFNIQEMARLSGVKTDADEVVGIDPSLDVVMKRGGGLVRAGDPSRSSRGTGGASSAELAIARAYADSNKIPLDQAIDHIRSGKYSPEKLAMDWTKLMIPEAQKEGLIRAGDPRYIDPAKIYEEGLARFSKNKKPDATIKDTYKHPSGKTFTRADIEARAKKTGVTPEEVIQQYGLQ